ncbi:MAG: cell division protein FtsA [Xanthobacteraceae bacterium]|nr:MAG: cell division protein FtsA [Xanthobacteraceae bacterium]
MTSLDHGIAPKMRPVTSHRPSVVAALDIGTSKIACMIGRLKPAPPQDVLPGRSHAIEVLGLSHVQSRGMKAGAVADMREAEQAVRKAVALAERMAGVQLEAVLLSVSAGRIGSALIEAQAETRGSAVTQRDLDRAMTAGIFHATGESRTALHALPVGYTVDGVKGVRNPCGMVARQFGVDLNVVTADATVAKNLMLVVERCHLAVEAMVAAPYVAGLAVLADDETDLGAAVIDMGAGTTTIATYSGGQFVHASGFALGGHHITMDIARGLGACIADAERIKTLYGTVLTGGSDARELLTVSATGGGDRDPPQVVSRAAMANIVRQRVEEIFEMVRDRLAQSPFAAEPQARVVLTGGASQLTGLPELAGRVLGRPVRVGRPFGLARLPEVAKGASFAVPAGLLVYPQYAHLEHIEPRTTRQLMTGTDGYFGKVGRWLRDSF